MEPYKLRTIKDIYTLIPKERLPLFLFEMQQSILEYYNLCELCDLGKVPYPEVQEVFEWIDDGKGEINVNINLKKES